MGIDTASNSPRLGAPERAELRALDNTPDSATDFSEVPEQPARGWHRASPYRLGHLLAVELDADVEEWVESLGSEAHKKVNLILRAAMKAEQ